MGVEMERAAVNKRGWQILFTSAQNVGSRDLDRSGGLKIVVSRRWQLAQIVEPRAKLHWTSCIERGGEGRKAWF
jgi:hypothetical protein